MGGEVGIGHDDLVAQSLQAAGHPFALGRLENHPPPGPRAEHGGETLRFGADPLLEQLAPVRQDADLTFLLVHVDAYMAHGWPMQVRHTLSRRIGGSEVFPAPATRTMDRTATPLD